MVISFSDMKRRYSSLADFFKRSGKSRAEMARRWRVTEATISRWVHGSRRPRGQQALDVARDAGVPLASLIGPAQTKDAA